MVEVLLAGVLGDGHLHPRRTQVHRLPAQERVRPADPRGGPEGPRAQAGDAGDGRPPDHDLDGGAVPHLLEPDAPGADGVLRHARLRGDRLRRRLDEGLAPPLARALGPLEAPAGSPRSRSSSRSSPRADWTRRSTTDVYLPLLDVDLPLSWGWYVLLFFIIAGAVERREPHRRYRRPRRRARSTIALLTYTAMSLVAALASVRAVGRRRPGRPRPRDPRREPDRGLDRLPLVQRLPRAGLHGRHRLDGARGRARRVRDHDEDRDRCCILIGGIFLIEALSVIVQVVSFKRFGRRVLPDGAAPPPLRDEGLVGDADHGPLLDRRPRSSAPARFVLYYRYAPSFAS